MNDDAQTPSSCWYEQSLTAHASRNQPAMVVPGSSDDVSTSAHRHRPTAGIDSTCHEQRGDSSSTRSEPVALTVPAGRRATAAGWRRVQHDGNDGAWPPPIPDCTRLLRVVRTPNHPASLCLRCHTHDTTQSPLAGSSHPPSPFPLFTPTPPTHSTTCRTPREGSYARWCPRAPSPQQGLAQGSCSCSRQSSTSVYAQPVPVRCDGKRCRRSLMKETAPP